MPRKKPEEPLLPCGLTAAEYHVWLNRPDTQSVFRFMELNGRPQSMLPNSGKDEYPYRLGYVTGWWSAIDFMRAQSKVTPTFDETPDYN